MFLMIVAGLGAFWLSLVAVDIAVDEAPSTSPLAAFIPVLLSGVMFLALAMTHGWGWLIGLAFACMVLGVALYRFLLT
jgi:hypothetical protein